ncbi:N-succinylarginine dihydrolase [Pantoea agglomerans]|uniref:N-succinylarginine dihydrolase n=1 Tax=Enterobacter agglomerans TaxID=549 RepID=A0A379AIP2_ENTAG|nr:N-succinylarginine dihydrolase [Pantoea agglomerans]
MLISLNCWRSFGRAFPVFVALEVPENRVSVKDAVETYLFNSQLLSRPDGTMMLVLPEESRQHPGCLRYLCEQVEADTATQSPEGVLICAKACITGVVQPACVCRWC